MLHILSSTLGTFLEWQFWVVTFCFGLLLMTPALIYGKEPLQNTRWFIEKPMSRFIWGLWNILIMTISFIVLAPLLLKNERIFGWILFFSIDYSGYFTIIAMVLTLSILEGSISYMRIPFVGGPLRANLTLALLTFILSDGTARLWPGIFLMTGIVLIGSLLSYIMAAIATAAIALTIPMRYSEKGPIFMYPLASFSTVIPAITYAAWIRWAGGY